MDWGKKFIRRVIHCGQTNYSTGDTPRRNQALTEESESFLTGL